MAKRIFLFLSVNLLVVLTLSLILRFFNLQPFLTSYGLNIPSLLIFCLVWGMGGAFISLGLSKMMAKWLMRVKIIDSNTHDPNKDRLLLIVHQLARQAHLPAMPEVGIYESSEVNAFATGPSKKRSLIAVSTGLLQKMSEKDIEGVISHEITHIANGDMVTMTLLQGIVNAFVMFLARILAYIFSGIGKSKEDSSGSRSYLSYTLFVFLFEFVFMLLGSLVLAWFSRVREFRADKGGAKLAGKEKMISALQSLQRLHNERHHLVENASFAALKISSSRKSNFILLFASHPPLEKRIEKLYQL